ncbi:MAG TPA: hypothetical protein VLA14_17655 [Polyangia bacterium]|jgi:hypothetical protein|nr:hypothetical protein [Polyangia bacterium]
MHPFPQESMQSVDVGIVDRFGSTRAPVRTAFLVAAVVWLSCSAPEPFRGGQGGLTSAGSGGASGTDGAVVPMGAAGSGTAGGTAGATDAAAPTGAAGEGGGSAGATNQPGTAGAVGSTDAGAIATGTAGSGTAGATGGGTAGAGGGADAGTSSGTAGMTSAPMMLSLPFNVSDHFSPTGFMGDGVVAGSITMSTDATACAGEPAAAMAGTCYTMTYQPQPIVAPAPSTWGGVYWQYPDNNWGTLPPDTVAAGAQAISFYAKGKNGNESVTFQAGGIVNAISTATPYTDTFTIRQTFALTTTWTKYTLPLTGLTYSAGVLGGFAWVATATNANPIVFFVHGIVWQ